MLIDDQEMASNEADCFIDCAHDMGVLGSDFCKLIHKDPSDGSTTIYQVATCGTDHLIKLWRIFCLKDAKNGEKSRLIPTTSQEHNSGTSTIFCTETMNAECVLTVNAHGSSVTCIK
jgi:hypothetical protein